jgi:hypothetical protein
LEELSAEWTKAQLAWGGSVSLSLPQSIPDPKSNVVAYIELDTRTTRVNVRLLQRHGLQGHIETVLAHELGHHLRYPHTLFDMRRQQLFLRNELSRLLSSAGAIDPAKNALNGKMDFVLNVFFDFLINTDLVALSDDDSRLQSFVAIYQALITASCAEAFGAVYMMMYEVAWGLPTHTLVSAKMHELLRQAVSDYEFSITRLVSFMDAHQGEVYLQLAAFLVGVLPFLIASNEACKGEAEGQGALEDGAGMGGELTDQEVARMLDESAEIKDARKWLDSNGAPTLGSGTRTSREGQASFPTFGDTGALTTLLPPDRVALAWYRKNARRASMQIPGSLTDGEPFIPGPTTQWDLDDELGKLDWMATLTTSGVAVPGQTTVQRTFFADDPIKGQKISPWIELYVDSSGSMPHPVRQMNPQVLAAFALLAAAQEAQGRVRVVQFSGSMQVRAMPDFVSAAAPVEQALLDYIGGGTEFPFQILQESCAKYRRRARVVRVLFSDSDFYWNVTRGPTAAEQQVLWQDACKDGDRFVALLVAAPDPVVVAPLSKLGVEFVLLRDRAQLLEAAKALAEKVYPHAG